MSTAPTIGIFSGYYPSHGGGIEIVTGILAEGLAARYPVLWCALDDGSAASHRFRREPLSGSDLAYRISGTPMPIPSPSAFRRIWRVVGASDVVLIADANFLTNAIAFAAAKLLRRSIVVTQHLGLPSTVSQFARLLTYVTEHLITRPMLRAADKVIYVSSAVQQHFCNVATRSEPLVIGHGVDKSLFHPPRGPKARNHRRGSFGFAPRERIASFVGRCTLSKGVNVIAEMARVRPDWTFVVAGSGPIDPADWNLPNVKVLGHLEPGRVAALYQASDVVVLPSPSESFSLVVREAMACGIPVICGDSILMTDPKLRRHLRAIPVDLGQMQQTAVNFAEALDDVPPPAPPAAAYVAECCSWDNILVQYGDTLERVARRETDTEWAVAA